MSRSLWRVRWTHTTWQPSAGAKSRLFARETAAREFAVKKAETGHMVSIDRSVNPVKFVEIYSDRTWWL